ncbi:lytic transglycosylase domain-containing protein [Candidatus Ichthyocystis sparus]|uniref:Putative soluble lytic murein transglycosylase n=2 Tax=Candidatus Ichthyocystis hellenicum TaxID=1561003 RepID=A0A0S4M328_9BURK|nr:lytic transglycosylase domain-containing protein [Candidatus Ichthyocystis sparus]CUT17282.1 putative soluble lytic murein transglycosylase [Candidatus Ichthyocystis hellenicum]
MKRFFLIVMFLFLPSVLHAAHSVTKYDNYQIKLIRRAYMHSNYIGNYVKKKYLLEKDFADLKNSELRIYPLFWLISSNISAVVSSDVDSFIQSYHKDFLTQDLIDLWLKELYRRGAYDSKMGSYYKRLRSPSFGAHCVYWEWKVRSGKASYSNFILPIKEKIVSSELDKECYYFVNVFLGTNSIRLDDAWTQAHILFEEGNVELLSNFLSTVLGITLSVDQIKKIRSFPGTFLIQMLSEMGEYSRAEKEWILMALSYLSRKKFNQAVYLKDKFLLRTAFTPSQSNYVISQLSYQSSRQHRNDSMFWLKQVVLQKNLLPYLQEWLARTALRKRDWKQLLKIVNNMPSYLAKSETWVYWKAYGLMSLGHKKEAEALWKSIADRYDYYSFLAREELHQDISLPTNEEESYDKKAYDRLRNNVSLKRAILLYRAGYFFLAMKEWNWGTRFLSDKHLLAAAHFAQDLGMLDRCIYTASKVSSYRGFLLQYPLPYLSTVVSTAKRFQLDPSWIYGVARQESRFMEKITSGVGASGLMQLMPHTASVVSRKFHLFEKKFKSEIVDPAVNIVLGSAYLQWVYRAFSKSLILAAAAYNAGPGRADLWRDHDALLPATIYVETIPFSETRQYVKKVLTNACIYKLILSKKFHHKKRSVKIKSLMKDVPSVVNFQPYLSEVP